MSVGVGKTFETVCLSVCLFVCLHHNSKTKDPKVFKLGVDDLGGWAIPEVNGFGIKWSKVKVKVTESICLYNDTSFPTTIAFHSHSLGGDTNKSNTAWFRTLRVHSSFF